MLGRTRRNWFHPMCGRRSVGRQRGNILRKQRQARVAGRFVAGCEHGLKSEANSQQGDSARQPRRAAAHQRALAERTHERAEMADAGKNQRVASREAFRRGRAARFDAEARERALDRRKISCSVFDECDVHNSPFVLGSTRFNCGSRVAANRSALANALKIAST